MLIVLLMLIYFFFFKQKTAYEMRISDWSSDVCSSDLRAQIHHRLRKIPSARIGRDPVRSSAYIGPPLRQRDRNREQSRYNPLDKIGRASCRERVCQYV